MPEREILEIKNKDGSTAFKCFEIEGLYIPLRCKDPEKRFKEIKEIEHKDGDILIVSYPKVGTHWIMDSIGMLMKGKAEIARSEALMLDFYPTLDGYTQKDSNRLGLSHLRPAQFSESQKAKAKFVLGLRNPKDTAVSMYYHSKADVDIHLQGSWDDFFQLYIEGKVVYGNFFDYYRDWQKFIESNPEQVLIIYYEDMHKNYQKELRRMADFFGLDLADEVLKQIAEKGNVKTVKEELMKDPKVQTLAKLLTKNGDLLFYRKGQVGDWKNHFTVAQSELFDQKTEKEMKGSIFKFDYSL